MSGCATTGLYQAPSKSRLDAFWTRPHCSRAEIVVSSNRPCRPSPNGTGQPLRVPAAAAVLAGDDLQEMPVRIFEIEAAPAIVVVDRSQLGLRGIGPVG